MPQDTRKNEIRRGEVWLADLNPVVGSEQGGRRPVVVIQNDIANKHSPVVTVASVHGHDGGKLYPTDVLIKKGEGGTTKDSVALVNQIRTISKKRLIKCYGTVDAVTIKRIEEALKIHLGLIDL